MGQRLWLTILLLITLCELVLSRKESAGRGNATRLAGAEETDAKPPNVTMTCGSEVIEVLLPADLVRSRSTGVAVSPDFVMFRPDASEGCRASLRIDGSYRLSLNLKSKSLCGSTVKEEDYQTEYRNEIILLDAEGGDIRSLYNVTCVYQDDERVILLPSSSSKLLIPDDNGAEIAVHMNLYRDKSYSQESAIKKETPEISVGHFLFVSVDLLPGGDDGGESSHLHIISKNCFASYFASARIKRMYHQFIADGCADKVDSTVAIQSNGVGWKSRWKFQMFKWVNTTAQRIYLFCDVHICDDRLLSDTEFCDMNKTKANCFGRTYGRRTRRELVTIGGGEDAVSGNMLSYGPIFPKDSVYLLDIPKGDRGDDRNVDKDEGPTSEEPTAVVPAAVGVVLGVCVIVIAVAAYLIWKRHVAQRIARRERSKKEIKPGFAFAIKSSNDQNIFNSTRGPGEEGELELDAADSNQRTAQLVTQTHETADKSKAPKRDSKQRKQNRRHSNAKTTSHGDPTDKPILESHRRRGTPRTHRRHSESERGRKEERERRHSRDEERGGDRGQASCETANSKPHRSRSESRTTTRHSENERGRKESRERRHSREEDRDHDRSTEERPHRSRSSSRTARRHSESERGRRRSRERMPSRNEKERGGGRSHRQRVSKSSEPRHRRPSRGRSTDHKEKERSRSSRRHRRHGSAPRREASSD